MATGRSPGPDGVLVEFYSQFWDLIGEEFTAMLETSIDNGRLPRGMNKGLVILLPKDGDWELLRNWQPITLLNTSYKVFAKTLKLWLRKLLPQVIQEGHSAFLPSRYILDAVMVQHETITWAKESAQPLAMLKLDFSKAYDMVSWKFLYAVMIRMELLQSFVDMIHMLLQEASASVLLNGVPPTPFSIYRGVR